MLGLGRVGIQLSPPFIHWDNSFSCSIQWNLGALLAQPQKNYLFLFPWEGFPWQTCKVLVPWKRTPWHWSEHVKFRPSWLFQKRCLSLHSWWDAMSARNGTCWVWDVLAFSFLHLSFFGTIASVVLSSGLLGRCLHNHRKTLVSSVYLCLFPRRKPTFSIVRWEGFPWDTCNVLAPWKRTQWHWSEHVKFRPSWLFQKRCLSLHSWWDAMLARNGTCWVWDVLAFSFLHLSFFGTIASVVLSSGILGRCLHNHRKTLVCSVYLCLFPREGFPRQTYIKQVGWKHSWIKVRL